MKSLEKAAVWPNSEPQSANTYLHSGLARPSNYVTVQCIRTTVVRSTDPYNLDMIGILRTHLLTIHPSPGQIFYHRVNQGHPVLVDLTFGGFLGQNSKIFWLFRHTWGLVSRLSQLESSMVLFISRIWYGHCQSDSPQYVIPTQMAGLAGLSSRKLRTCLLRNSYSENLYHGRFHYVFHFRFLGCGLCFLLKVDLLISGSTRFGLHRPW